MHDVPIRHPLAQIAGQEHWSLAVQIDEACGHPDLILQPLAGKQFRLSELSKAQATVIAFVSTSCPLSKRFAPTLAALERDYSARGVRFVFVDPLKSDTANQITEAIRVHGFKGPFVRDTDGRIKNSLGAISVIPT